MALLQDVGRCQRGRSSHRIYAVAAVEVKTVKIGTRGSPLALAQAYMTRDLLKVQLLTLECHESATTSSCYAAIKIKRRHTEKNAASPSVQASLKWSSLSCRSPSLSSERRVP